MSKSPVERVARVATNLYIAWTRGRLAANEPLWKELGEAISHWEPLLMEEPTERVVTPPTPSLPELLPPPGVAAYWLRNHREPKRYGSYELRWRGRKDEWPRRTVHGRRPTSEATVLDDIVAIFRETPATYVVVKGLRFANNSLSDTTLAAVRRSNDKSSDLDVTSTHYLFTPWPNQP